MNNYKNDIALRQETDMDERFLLSVYSSTRQEEMRLVDFKVRVIDGSDGTAAKVRVQIESRDSSEIWSTIGVSENVIEASWQALVDSIQYKLSKATNGK